MTAIVVAALAAARMKTMHLIALLAISSLACFVVEHTNISAGLLEYTGSADVSLFTISGWMVMMVVIIQLSDFLTGWLKDLGIFKEIRSWKLLPFAASLIIFTLFFSWEVYLAIASSSVLVMYTVMAAIGLFYSWKHSIEWNASLLVVSVAVGGLMGLLGSFAGFWLYPFGEALAVFFALSWTMNTMAVHRLAYLVGIDLGAYEKRRLLPKKIK